MRRQKYTTGHEDWYTPEYIIEKARRTMGSIDLDPASSAIANTIVKATTFYTKQDDGLSKQWKGNVWMNPPFTRGIIDKFTAKLAHHYAHGDVPQACALTNNGTETYWFQNLARTATAVCFVYGRTNFLRYDGQSIAKIVGNSLQGQVIFYFGPNYKLFVNEFREIGWISFPAMLCGHPRSSLYSSDEGTSFCFQCQYESINHE